MYKLIKQQGSIMLIEASDLLVYFVVAGLFAYVGYMADQIFLSTKKSIKIQTKRLTR
jgi:hypothetical protein